MSHRTAVRVLRAQLDAERESAAKTTDQQAILDVLVCSQILVHRANGFRMTVKLAQARGARRERRNGTVAPLDLDAAYDRLVTADEGLNRAFSTLLLHSDPETVRRARAVNRAGASVIEATMDRPRRGLNKVRRQIELGYTAALPGQADEIDRAVDALVLTQVGLTNYARDKYGLDYAGPDLEPTP